MDAFFNRILPYPRDAILFLNACLRRSTNSRTLEWPHINVAERDYSEMRLKLLFADWADIYPELSLLLEQFRHQPARLPWPDLATVLAKATWPGPPLAFAVGGPDVDEQRSWFASSSFLARLLYDLGVLGLARSVHDQAVFAPLDLGRVQWPGDDEALVKTWIEVHPAYRRALQISVP